MKPLNIILAFFLFFITLKSAFAITITGDCDSECNVTTSDYSLWLKEGVIDGLYWELDDYTEDYVGRNDLSGIVLGALLIGGSWRINEGQTGTYCDNTGSIVNCSNAYGFNNYTFHEDFIELDSSGTSGTFRIYHYTEGDYDGAAAQDVIYFGNNLKDSSSSGWQSRTSLSGVYVDTNSTADYGLFIQWDQSLVNFGYNLRSASGQDYHTFAIGRTANIAQGAVVKQYIRVYEKNTTASGDDQWYSINNCFKEDYNSTCTPPIGINDTSLNITYFDCSIPSGNCQGFTELINESFNFSMEADRLGSNPYNFFYFNITDRADLNKVHFKVDHADDSRLNYNFINPVYSYNHDDWNLISDYEVLGNDLHFNQTFTQSSVEIASWIPYTYEDLVNFVDEYNGTSSLNISVYGKSVEGRNLYRFDISNYSTSGLGYVLISRQHPSESYPSFSVEQAIKWLLGSNSTAQKIRSRFNFYIYPMLNPDGVEQGADRESNNTNELNTKWGSSRSSDYPEVNETYMDLVRLNGSFHLFNDWHSSKQFGPFFYSVENSTSDADYKTNRTILVSALKNWTMFKNHNDTDLSGLELAYYEIYDRFGVMSITQESPTANNSITESMHRQEGINNILAVNNYFCSFVNCSIGNVTSTSNTTSSTTLRSEGGIPILPEIKSFKDFGSLLKNIGYIPIILVLLFMLYQGNQSAEIRKLKRYAKSRK